MEKPATSPHHTIGGVKGHWLRRLIHLSIAIYPILYYYLGASIAGVFHIQATTLLIVIGAIVVILEGIRLWRGWIIFGQRHHEARQISSVAWGILSIVLVLLLAPSKAYAIPIIWSCAFVDPLLGELRGKKVSPWLVFSIGVMSVAVIWWIATLWLGTPWWWALVMGPLTIAAEWPVLKWVDDNALMQLVPLLVVLMV